MLTPVYGVVLKLNEVSFVRAFPLHRPELTKTGKDIIESMKQRWQEGFSISPWLYARDKHYVVADDYFWLALIEKYGPEQVSAQVFGDPLSLGLVQKVGPLSKETIEDILGTSTELG